MQMTQTLNDLVIFYTNFNDFHLFYTKIVQYIKSLLSHSRQSSRDRNPKKLVKNNIPNYICT